MKKRMMKLAAISMSVLMAASLGACGSGGGDDKSSGSDDSKKEESTASADESKGGDKEIVMLLSAQGNARISIRPGPEVL